MTTSESSVIARKLRNYYIAQNLKAVPKPQSEWVQELEQESLEEESHQPGYFKHCLMVTLMGAAVFLTELSLVLIKFVRRLEHGAR